MDNKLYKFGIDWLNGVCHLEENFNDFVRCLGKIHKDLDVVNWSLCETGMYNYKRRFMYRGRPIIQIAYNPLTPDVAETVELVDLECNNKGIFVSISGDGIRLLSHLNCLEDVLKYLKSIGFKASRLDVYMDCLDKDNPYVDHFTKAFKNFYTDSIGKPNVRCNLQRVSRSGSPNTKNLRQFRMVDSAGNVYYNTELGTHSSNFGMFRLYNKMEELKGGRLSEYSEHMLKEYCQCSDYWWRFEYEVHKDFACQLFDQIDLDEFSMSSAYYAVTDKMFQFVDCPSRGVNKSKSPVTTIWDMYISELSENVCFV